MKGYLVRFQGKKSEKPLSGKVSKGTKDTFDTFGTSSPKGSREISEGDNGSETKADFIHWQKFTPEQRVEILPTIKAGDPVRVYSEVLSEIVWWVKGEQAAKGLRQDPRYQGECVYTLVELRELAGKSSEFLRDIYRLKKEFGATLAKTEPKPVLRADEALITASTVNKKPVNTVQAAGEVRV